MKCTIYKNAYQKVEGVDLEVTTILEGIKSKRWDGLISNIRTITDDAEKRKVKAQLPAVTFAGVFSERTDKKIIKHSGLMVLDFDHVNVKEVRESLSKLKYVYSHFISPSGDGVKALIKIPSSIERHAGHYNAIIEEIKSKLNYELDTTSRNLSRLCFVSADETLFLNEDAIEFTKHLEDKIIKTKITKTVSVKTDYKKIDIAVQMIRNTDVNKHNNLLRASNLIGGYIASGVVDEHTSISILEQEIQSKDIADFDAAKLTIQKGIAFGKTMPLYEHEELEEKFNVQIIKQKYKKNKKKTYDFLTDDELDEDTLLKYRNGGFELGLETGHNVLDKHFRFKTGTWSVILGHSNVGKSYFVWWLMVISSVKYGWKWVVFSSENDIPKVKKLMMEFYTQTPIVDMSDKDYTRAYNFIITHFKFIRIDKSQNAIQIMEYASILIDDDKDIKGMLIDPYNSLSKHSETYKRVGANTHEYDYEISSMFVQFSRLHDICLFVTAHANTSALRMRHYKGHDFEGQPMPPEASDIEGGGKFVNRVTGFFMVIHRYLYLLEERKYTHIHIKKVKDTESGGEQTASDDPIKFSLKGNMFRFVEEFGVCPIEYNIKLQPQPPLSEKLPTISPTEAFGDEVDLFDKKVPKKYFDDNDNEENFPF